MLMAWFPQVFDVAFWPVSWLIIDSKVRLRANRLHLDDPAQSLSRR